MWQTKGYAVPMLASVFGGDGLYVVIIALVVLVGGSQLPKIARNLGLAGKEFRKAQDEAAADSAKSKDAPVPSAPESLPSGPVDDRVTLSKAELNALLDEREQQRRS